METVTFTYKTSSAYTNRIFICIIQMPRRWRIETAYQPWNRPQTTTLAQNPLDFGDKRVHGKYRVNRNLVSYTLS